jgi:acyl dehydratase
VAWLGHLVTNWMGDAGFLRRLNARVLRHNLIGDTTWCRGRVTAKGPGGSVTLELAGTNQRGETTASATAEVVLPTR